VLVIGDVAFATEGPGGALRLEPRLLAGLPMAPNEGAMPWVSELGGHLPDALFLTLAMVDPNGASYTDPRVFRLGDGGWAVAMDRVARSPGAPADHDSYAYSDFAPWVGDRVLALAVFDPQAPGAQPSQGDFRAARPRLDVVRGDAALRPPDLDPAVCPDRLLALPTGEIFVFGQRCTTGAVYAQRFAALAEGAERPAVIEPVAAPSCAGGAHYVRSLDARTGSDVWLAVELSCGDADTSYLAHFDGRAWSVVTPPAPGVVTSLSATPEGAVWITVDADEGGLFRRWPDGRWDQVPLPHVDASHPSEVLAAKDVWAKSAGDVWVVAARYVDGHYKGSIVVRSREVPEVLALPGPDEIRWAQADVAPPAPATRACAHPQLVIAKLPEAAPADFDYAELRAAVRGHIDLADVTYREVMWRGDRWAAASAPFERLEQLRALLEAKLFGARPSAYCGFYPRVVRSFTIGPGGDIELPP
jgi:hypothetical protein